MLWRPAWSWNFPWHPLASDQAWSERKSLGEARAGVSRGLGVRDVALSVVISSLTRDGDPPRCMQQVLIKIVCSREIPARVTSGQSPQGTMLKVKGIGSFLGSRKFSVRRREGELISGASAGCVCCPRSGRLFVPA